MLYALARRISEENHDIFFMLDQSLRLFNDHLNHLHDVRAHQGAGDGLALTEPSFP